MELLIAWRLLQAVLHEEFAQFVEEGYHEINKWLVQRRVLQDQDSAEVCAALAISEDNLFVRLHRARRQLLN